MNKEHLNIINDKIFIGNSVDDLKAEISENLWRISMSPEEKSGLTVQDLLDFSTKLIAKRSQQVQNAAKHGMIFYTWFDTQASQLRFCLISDFHSKLPFKTEIVDAALEVIIEEFLASRDNIPYLDLSFDTSDSIQPIETFKLKVFQKRIP